MKYYTGKQTKWSDVAIVFIGSAFEFLAFIVFISVFVAFFGATGWLFYKLIELFFMYPVGGAVFGACFVVAVYMEHKAK